MDVVKGFPQQIDYADRADLRKRMSDGFSELIQEIRQQIILAKDPLREAIKLVVGKLAREVSVEGLDNIPAEGKVILAMNHPFPTVDDFSLLQATSERFPKRPWAFIANVNSVSRHMPTWRDMPSFGHRIIPVERADSDSFGRVLNGRTVVRAGTEFLTMHQDPILLIAPNGSDDIFCNRISEPHLGFTRIAQAAKATIVPVLYTGTANLDTLDFTVKGQILPPIEYSTEENPVVLAQIWHQTVMGELNK